MIVKQFGEHYFDNSVTIRKSRIYREIENNLIIIA